MWLTEVNCGINKHLIYHITLQPLSTYLFNIITFYKLEFLLNKWNNNNFSLHCYAYNDTQVAEGFI